MRQTGQSLLEVTIAIGIAVIVLSALTIITLSGFKNSQFSQNQVTATKLAQDSIEQVRSMRDRNASVCSSASIYNWSSLFLTAGSCSSGCNFSIQLSGSCSYNNSSPSPAPPYLLPNNIPQPIPGNANFNRLINVVDFQNSTKKVTAIISWNDSGGAHSVNLATDLGPK